MRLSEFQDKHAGDLTGPALEEIKHRQQALKAQLMIPPVTGECPWMVLGPVLSNGTQCHMVRVAKSAPRVRLAAHTFVVVLQLRCV